MVRDEGGPVMTVDSFSQLYMLGEAVVRSLDGYRCRLGEPPSSRLPSEDAPLSTEEGRRIANAHKSSKAAGLLGGRRKMAERRRTVLTDGTPRRQQLSSTQENSPAEPPPPQPASSDESDADDRESSMTNAFVPFMDETFYGRHAIGKTGKQYDKSEAPRASFVGAVKRRFGVLERRIHPSEN